MLRHVTELEFVSFLISTGVMGLLGADIACMCIGWGLGICIGEVLEYWYEKHNQSM